MGDNHNSSLKEEVCENSCLIGIRRCRMAAADVVRSWQGATEVDKTPELGKWVPPHRRASMWCRCQARSQIFLVMPFFSSRSDTPILSPQSPGVLGKCAELISTFGKRSFYSTSIVPESSSLDNDLPVLPSQESI